MLARPVDPNVGGDDLVSRQRQIIITAEQRLWENCIWGVSQYWTRHDLRVICEQIILIILSLHILIAQKSKVSSSNSRNFLEKLQTLSSINSGIRHFRCSSKLFVNLKVVISNNKGKIYSALEIDNINQHEVHRKVIEFSHRFNKNKWF